VEELPDVAPDTLVLWGFLPDFVKQGDEANGYPFLLWLNGICQQQQEIDDLARDDGPNPGWSILFDIDRCPDYALPWLAQFVGTRFNSSQITDAEQRAAIAFERYSWARGTTTYMMAAAAPYLTASGSILIDERTTDAYHFTVTVLGLLGYTYAELDSIYQPYNALDAAFASYNDFTQNQAGIIAALTAAKPAGLIMTVDFVRDYNQIDAIYTPYTVLDSSFATYGEMQ
jgi:hypothetical protein